MKMGRFGNSLRRKPNGRHNVVPRAPADVVHLSRRIAVGAKADRQHREPRFREPLHHRQHLAARRVHAVQQQNARLVGVAARQPSADLLVVAGFQPNGFRVGPGDDRRRLGERPAAAARQPPGNQRRRGKPERYRYRNNDGQEFQLAALHGVYSSSPECLSPVLERRTTTMPTSCLHHILPTALCFGNPFLTRK